MANAAQPSSATTKHSYSFQYPQLDDSSSTISAQDSTSLEMDIDSQSEDGQNSLSDSTFEIISQSSFHTSDDEFHEDGTDSMISFGVPTPEEGSSVDGDEYIPPQQVEPATAPFLVNDRGQPAANQQASESSPEMSVNLSTFSTATVTESHDDWIRFKEPSTSFASGLFDVTPNAQRILNQGSGSRTTVNIEKTLASHIMRLNGPFRILFCATSSESFLKESILEKIGQALHASAVPKNVPRELPKEKLNIVPISSFGNEGSTPEVMLVPSTGLQFEVVDCSEAGLTAFARSDRGRARNYHRPDLAVFVHRNLSHDCESLKLDFLRSEELKRRGIPVIDICGDIPDHSQPGEAAIRNPTALAQLGFEPSKDRAVHMACETTELSGNEQFKFSIPIDYQTFQQMDSLELNRNITAIVDESSILNFEDAQWLILSLVKTIWCQMVLLYSFMGHLSYNRYAVQLFAAARSVHANALHPCFKQVRIHASGLRKDFLTGMILSLLCCSGLWLYQNELSPAAILPRPAIKTPITRTLPVEHTAWPTTRQTLPAPVLPKLLSGSPPVPKTRALTAVQVETGLSVIPALHKPCNKARPKPIPEFKLLEAQDGQLFLQSTKPLPRKWKPPATFVSASKDGKPFEVSVSKLVGTTFEIHLDRTELCAPIVVTVWSHEGQASGQTFQLSRRCLEIPLMDALAKFYADARTRTFFMAPGLGNMLYSRALGLTSAQIKRINASYATWAPQVAHWAHESVTQIKRFSKEAEAARLAFNAMGDQYMERVSRGINDKAETIRTQVLKNMDAAKATLSYNYDIMHHRALQLHLLGLQKVLGEERFPRAASAPVKRARARAVLVKDKMVDRCSFMRKWAARAQGRIRRFVNRRSELRQQRRWGCKKRTKGQR